MDDTSFQRKPRSRGIPAPNTGTAETVIVPGEPANTDLDAEAELDMEQALDGADNADPLYSEGVAESELLDSERPGFWAPVVTPLAALIGGNSTDAFVRIMVVKRMCQRTDKTYWTREEVTQDLAWILPHRIRSALNRLRASGIVRSVATLEHMRMIEITPTGRALVASLEVLKQYGDDEELRFGYVLTQLAGSAATGSVSPQVIDVCLSTISGLITRATEAIDLRSERLIEEAHQELQRQWRWLDQAAEILARLADDPNMTSLVHRKAQQTGTVLATAQRLDSVLKRHGAEIAHQRERMTKSGLSGRMVADWLRTLSAEALVELASDGIRHVPRPMLLNPLNVLDVAHAALDRGRAAAIQAPPLPKISTSVERAERPPEVDDTDFTRFVDELRSKQGELSVVDLVLVPGDFPRTTLRLGTLVRAEASSIATAKSAREPIFEGLNVELRLSNDLTEVGDSAVSRMTGGSVVIQSKNTKEKS